MTQRPTVGLCFVCLGNICRSPTAEAVMLHLVADAGLSDVIRVDSAGTAGWHCGDPPDRRSAAEAKRRGVAIDHLRGRRFVPGDFQRFDLVLAMDRDNLDDLLRLAPGPDEGARVRLLRSFDPSSGDEDLDVPDPYYGGPEGFRRVFDLCEAACKGLLAHVQSQLLSADHG